MFKRKNIIKLSALLFLSVFGLQGMSSREKALAKKQNLYLLLGIKNGGKINKELVTKKLNNLEAELQKYMGGMSKQKLSYVRWRYLNPLRTALTVISNSEKKAKYDVGLEEGLYWSDIMSQQEQELAKKVNLYSLLGIPKKTRNEDIKKLAEERMQAINLFAIKETIIDANNTIIDANNKDVHSLYLAYAVLINSQKKAKYDAGLANGEYWQDRMSKQEQELAEEFNFYFVLGIPKKARDKDIKKLMEERKQVTSLFVIGKTIIDVDKNDGKDNDVHSLYLAYTVLSNPLKRRKYDKKLNFGTSGFKKVDVEILKKVEHFNLKTFLKRYEFFDSKDDKRLKDCAEKNISQICRNFDFEKCQQIVKDFAEYLWLCDCLGVVNTFFTSEDQYGVFDLWMLLGDIGGLIDDFKTSYRDHSSTLELLELFNVLSISDTSDLGKKAAKFYRKQLENEKVKKWKKIESVLSNENKKSYTKIKTEPVKLLTQEENRTIARTCYSLRLSPYYKKIKEDLYSFIGKKEEFSLINLVELEKAIKQVYVELSSKHFQSYKPYKDKIKWQHVYYFVKSARAKKRLEALEKIESEKEKEKEKEIELLIVTDSEKEEIFSVFSNCAYLYEYNKYYCTYDDYVEDLIVSLRKDFSLANLLQLEEVLKTVSFKYNCHSSHLRYTMPKRNMFLNYLQYNLAMKRYLKIEKNSEDCIKACNLVKNARGRLQALEQIKSEKKVIEKEKPALRQAPNLRHPSTSSGRAERRARQDERRTGRHNKVSVIDRAEKKVGVASEEPKISPQNLALIKKLLRSLSNELVKVYPYRNLDYSSYDKEHKELLLKEEDNKQVLMKIIKSCSLIVATEQLSVQSCTALMSKIGELRKQVKLQDPLIIDGMSIHTALCQRTNYFSQLMELEQKIEQTKKILES